MRLNLNAPSDYASHHLAERHTLIGQVPIEEVEHLVLLRRDGEDNGLHSLEDIIDWLERTMPPPSSQHNHNEPGDDDDEEEEEGDEEEEEPMMVVYNDQNVAATEEEEEVSTTTTTTTADAQAATPATVRTTPTLDAATTTELEGMRQGLYWDDFDQLGELASRDQDARRRPHRHWDLGGTNINNTQAANLTTMRSAWAEALEHHNNHNQQQHSPHRDQELEMEMEMEMEEETTTIRAPAASAPPPLLQQPSRRRQQQPQRRDPDVEHLGLGVGPFTRKHFTSAHLEPVELIRSGGGGGGGKGENEGSPPLLLPSLACRFKETVNLLLVRVVRDGFRMRAIDLLDMRADPTFCPPLTGKHAGMGWGDSALSMSIRDGNLRMLQTLLLVQGHAPSVLAEMVNTSIPPPPPPQQQQQQQQQTPLAQTGAPTLDDKQQRTKRARLARNLLLLAAHHPPSLPAATMMITTGATALPPQPVMLFATTPTLPLLLAATEASFSSIGILKLLLESKANPNAVNADGDTALGIIVRNNTPWTHRAMRCLLQAKASPDAVPFCTSAPASFYNNHYHHHCVAAPTQAQQQQTSSCHYFSRAPLCVAAAAGHLYIVQQLLTDFQANPNPSSSSSVSSPMTMLSRTPLALAAAGGHAAVVALLLRAKANPTTYDMDGETAMHVAARNDHGAVLSAIHVARPLLNLAPDNSRGQTPLHVAAYAGALRAAHALLLHCRPSTPAAAEGPLVPTTTMMPMPRDDKDDDEKEQVDDHEEDWEDYDGATSRDDEGLTPVHIAVRLGQLAFLHLIDQTQPTTARAVHLLCCARDATGRTPLHVAVLCGHVPIVQFLLRRGADPNVRWRNAPLPKPSAAMLMTMTMTPCTGEEGEGCSATRELPPKGSPSLHMALQPWYFAATTELRRWATDRPRLLQRQQKEKNKHITNNNNGAATTTTSTTTTTTTTMMMMRVAAGDTSEREEIRHHATTPLILRALLDAKADPNLLDGLARTPLHVAVDSFSGLRRVHMLLEAGASPLIRDAHQRLPVQIVRTTLALLLRPSSSRAATSTTTTAATMKKRSLSATTTTITTTPGSTPPLSSVPRRLDRRQHQQSIDRLHRLAVVTIGYLEHPPLPPPPTAPPSSSAWHAAVAVAVGRAEEEAARGSRSLPII
jgi:ankyrin repeat protein